MFSYQVCTTSTSRLEKCSKLTPRASLSRAPSASEEKSDAVKLISFWMVNVDDDDDTLPRQRLTAEEMRKSARQVQEAKELERVGKTDEGKAATLAA